MSTDYTVYTATIPAMFLGIPEVGALVAFLNEYELALSEGGNVHFKVEGADSEYYYLCGLSTGPLTPEPLDGFHEEVSLLQQLIQDDKICLVYEYSWSSGDGWDEEEEHLDPVGLAEQIPTLILQEVLAKRLASDQSVSHADPSLTACNK